jgi:cellulose synthase/poly-beta-1,6-N-acetylglucosamine synthase-like glycosyltransferase
MKKSLEIGCVAAGQLCEAWHAFRYGPATLAVVQAHLVIWNERESWISRQFALDYAVWFRLILPALVHVSRFLPLGGTSNHFDITYLRGAGGWDTFSVTEDADVGARLARPGMIAKCQHCFGRSGASIFLRRSGTKPNRVPRLGRTGHSLPLVNTQ